MMVEDKENRVLIIAEQERGRLAHVTLELLEAGRELAGTMAAGLCVALLGNGLDDLAEQIAYFSDEVYVLDHPLLAEFHPDFCTHALEALCRDIAPTTILMAHTLDNLGVAPRLAYRLGASLIADTIHLDLGPEGELFCDKPIYGDNAMATFIVENKPRVVTLRPKAMKGMERRPNKGRVTLFGVILEKNLARTELFKVVEGEHVDLNKADAVVAAGRGIKEVEGLARLQVLVKTLKRYFGKVELGASRPLIDQGWLPSSRQIGLTGEKVAPDLYIGVGISGATGIDALHNDLTDGAEVEMVIDKIKEDENGNDLIGYKFRPIAR